MGTLSGLYPFLTKLYADSGSHGGFLSQGRWNHGVIGACSQVLLQIRGLSPFCDPRPFPVHVSSSHTVAVRTAAPISRLRRARAQEGETNLCIGCSGHVAVTVARLDLPRLIRSRSMA